MKNTKRSLITSLVTLLLCSCMFIGSTFAWFTDTVSNTGNKIQAGTLKVDLLQNKDEDFASEDKYVSIKDQTAPVFDSGEGTGLLWEPGQTQVAYLAVANKGNLALKYNIVLDVVDKQTNQDLTQAMAGAFTFAIVNTKHDMPSTKYTDWVSIIGSTGAVSGNLLQAIRTQTGDETAISGRITAAPNGKLLTDEKDYFAIAIHMNEEAGNAYQNGLIEFDVNIVATQYTYEEDGFGSDQYDLQAEYPVVSAREFPKFNPKNPGTNDLVIKKAGKIESASVPATAATKITKQLIAQLPTPPAETDNQELTLTLNVTELGSKEVEEETKTTTTINLDIDMSAILTITAQDGTLKDSKSETVKEMTGWTVIKYQLETGLANVKVTHSGNEMQALDTADEIPTNEQYGGYFYEPSTGLLTIKTKTFSPFDVSFEKINLTDCIIVEDLTQTDWCQTSNSANGGNDILPVILTSIANASIYGATYKITGTSAPIIYSLTNGVNVRMNVKGNGYPEANKYTKEEILGALGDYKYMNILFSVDQKSSAICNINSDYTMKTSGSWPFKYEFFNYEECHTSITQIPASGLHNNINYGNINNQTYQIEPLSLEANKVYIANTTTLDSNCSLFFDGYEHNGAQTNYQQKFALFFLDCSGNSITTNPNVTYTVKVYKSLTDAQNNQNGVIVKTFTQALAKGSLQNAN